MTAAGLSGKRVLVAEDEVLIAMLFESALEGMGAEVIAAASVAAALARIDDCDGKIDAALLDGNLAGEPVYPVADRLEALGIRFVFLTGYDGRGFAARYAGAPVLRKPVSVPVLIQALCSCIGDNAAGPDAPPGGEATSPP